MSLTEKQIEKIDKLVQRMRDEVEFVDDYYTSNPDNGTADYVQSVGYGGDLMHQVEDALRRSDLQRELEPDELDYIKALVKSYHPNNPHNRDIVNQLIDITNIQFESSYWVNTLELCSMQLGEIEHQIDDELYKELEALNEVEFKAFCDQVRSYVYYDKLSRYIHVDHGYSRWYLELNIDLLREAMKSKPIESVVQPAAASNKKLNKLEVIK